MLKLTLVLGYDGAEVRDNKNKLVCRVSRDDESADALLALLTGLQEVVGVLDDLEITNGE